MHCVVDGGHKVQQVVHCAGVFLVVHCIVGGGHKVQWYLRHQVVHFAGVFLVWQQ